MPAYFSDSRALQKLIFYDVKLFVYAAGNLQQIEQEDAAQQSKACFQMMHGSGFFITLTHLTRY